MRREQAEQALWLWLWRWLDALGSMLWLCSLSDSCCGAGVGLWFLNETHPGPGLMLWLDALRGSGWMSAALVRCSPRFFAQCSPRLWLDALRGPCSALTVALAPALAPALALVFGSFAEPTQAQSPSFFSAGVHQMPRQRRR